MSKPHKHAELIKAWADGATIEYWDSHGGAWVPATDNNPAWSVFQLYRIKPDPYKPYADALAAGKSVDARPKGLPPGAGWAELLPTYCDWHEDYEYRVNLPWQDERDAHARGEPIEFRIKSKPGAYFEDFWGICPRPIWSDDCEYRVKPKTQVLEAVVHGIVWADPRPWDGVSVKPAPFVMPKIYLAIELTDGKVTNVTVKEWK